MSRCPTLAKQPSHLFFGSVYALLAGSLILFPGCDTGNKSPVVVKEDAKAPAHTDDHDKSDHDHDHMDEDHSDEKSAQKADDGHSHEMPATVEAAIAQLKKVTGQVRQALKSGETDKADSLVHSIGHLMEDLNEKIAAAKIDEKVKDAATAASNKIFEAYGEIDEALHAAEDEIKKIDFGSFGPTINKATKNLEALLLEAKDAVVGEKPKKDDKKAAADKKAADKKAADKKAADKKAADKKAADKKAADTEAAKATASSDETADEKEGSATKAE